MVTMKNNNKNIKNIIFDMDGTLLDSAGDLSICLNHILDKFNLNNIDEEIVKENMGFGVKYLIENILKHSFKLSGREDDISNVYNKFAEYYLPYYDDYSANNSKMYDGVLENLEDLYSKDYNMFIVTNKPHNVLLSVMECLNINKYFVEVIGANKYEYIKPSVELWNIISKKYNLDAKQSIVIGDGTPDYQFAEVAGMHVCMLLYGITKEEILLELNAEKYANSFEEATKYIYSLG